MKIECSSDKIVVSPIEITLSIKLENLNDFMLIQKMYDDGVEVSNYNTGDNDEEMKGFLEYIVNRIYAKIY